MKNYTDYTRAEKERIISKGGNAKRDLQKAFDAWIDTVNLDSKHLNIINSTDPSIDVFGTCDDKTELINYLITF